MGSHTVCTLDKRSLHKHTYEVPFVSMKFSRCSCTYMTFRTGHIFEGYLFVMIAPSVPKHTYCRCGSSLLLLLMTRSASFFNASLFKTFQQGHHSALGRCYSMICRDHGFGLVGGRDGSVFYSHLYISLLFKQCCVDQLCIGVLDGG